MGGTLSQRIKCHESVFENNQFFLSNGNLETPLDEWIQDPAEGDKTQERLDLILVIKDQDNSSMGAIKKMANLLLSVCEFADVKIGLADKVINTYNEYMACDAKFMGLSNNVIRLEVSKEYALWRLMQLALLCGTKTQI